MDEKEALIQQSDFIIMCLPLTDHTHHYIGKYEFERMKQGSMFINVGRGATVDEEALIQALQSGHLAGAGLDVTEIEPLPSNSMLWELDNVMITSHSAGVTNRKEARRMKLFAQLLSHYVQDKPLKNVVDRTLGY